MHEFSIKKAAVFCNLIILGQSANIKVTGFSTATTTRNNSNARTTEENILLFIILDYLIFLAHSLFFLFSRPH